LKKTYVLVSDAHRARCFERHAPTHNLTELAGFIHPHESLTGASAGGDLTGAAGKGHGRTGHAGTQFEPHTEVDDKERAAFARTLADYINEAVQQQRCQDVILIASAPMLGELHRHLSSAANKAVVRRVSADLTHYEGSELKKRVDRALELPD
jgi:protein required for attachment to host cells